MKVLVFDCRKVLEINCRKMYVFACFLQVDVYDGEEKCFFQKELLFYIYEMYQRIILHTNAFEKDGYYSCNFEDCSKYFQTVSANIDATLEFIENIYGEKIPLDTSFIKNFIPKAS